MLSFISALCFGLRGFRKIERAKTKTEKANQQAPELKHKHTNRKLQKCNADENNGTEKNKPQNFVNTRITFVFKAYLTDH